MEDRDPPRSRLRLTHFVLYTIIKFSSLPQKRLYDYVVKKSMCPCLQGQLAGRQVCGKKNTLPQPTLNKKGLKIFISHKNVLLL
jgi:hypothetical protein